MASTTVTLDGAGFEASDAALAVWLELLVREIDEPVDPPWLQEVKAEWHEQATAGFSFGVMPQLERFVTDDDRRRRLIALSEAALKVLDGWGDTAGADRLNEMKTGGEDSFFTEDVPTETFRRVGRYFLRLLQGKLTPEEIDSRLL
jgi:hypothetical protein